LVQASWVILFRTKSVQAEPPRAWPQRIVARRDKRVAVVALARPVGRDSFGDDARKDAVCWASARCRAWGS